MIAGQLRTGERLKQSHGTLTQVTRITPMRGPPVMVYNLEIDGEHVYHVGAHGLLVHNVCPWDIAFSRPVQPDELFKHGDWAGRPIQEAIEEASTLGRLPDGLTLGAELVNGRWVAANNRTLYVAQQAGLRQVHPTQGPSVTKSIFDHFKTNGVGGPIDP